MRVFRSGLFLLILSLLLSSCLARRDALAPIITIYDPPNGATRGLEQASSGNLQSPQVKGFAMDDNGIVSIKVDNTDLLASQSDYYTTQKGKKLVEFVFAIRQQSGEFAANITVEDEAGNVSVLPYRLIIDTEPPTLEASAERLSSSRIRVTGIARDNDAVKNISVEGVPQAFIAAPEQAFNVDVTASGEVTIVVEDRAGNQFTSTVSP